MSKQMGGFAGKSLTPDSPWGMVKLFLCLLPPAMIANKFLQGNVWGIPNREHGITPINEVIGKSSEDFVDVYLQNSLDTSGFVGDGEDDRPLRPAGEHNNHTINNLVTAGGSSGKSKGKGGFMAKYFGAN